MLQGGVNDAIDGVRSKVAIIATTSTFSLLTRSNLILESLARCCSNLKTGWNRLLKKDLLLLFFLTTYTLPVVGKSWFKSNVFPNWALPAVHAHLYASLLCLTNRFSSLQKLTQTGLQKHDPRLKECLKQIYAVERKNGSRDVLLNRDEFRRCPFLPPSTCATLQTYPLECCTVFVVAVVSRRTWCW